jgi:hypothetical protein
MLYANDAMSYSASGSFNHCTKAPKIDTTKVEEVPKPLPAGASTKVCMSKEHWSQPKRASNGQRWKNMKIK